MAIPGAIAGLQRPVTRHIEAAGAPEQLPDTVRPPEARVPTLATPGATVLPEAGIILAIRAEVAQEVIIPAGLGRTTLVGPPEAGEAVTGVPANPPGEVGPDPTGAEAVIAVPGLAAQVALQEVSGVPAAVAPLEVSGAVAVVDVLPGVAPAEDAQVADVVINLNSPYNKH